MDISLPSGHVTNVTNGSMLLRGRAGVKGGGPALDQHWLEVSESRIAGDVPFVSSGFLIYHHVLYLVIADVL